MKTVIKDPLWAILGCYDCHTARPEEFISLQVKHLFLACCHLDLLGGCNFVFPVVPCSIRQLPTKTAPIILDGATCRLLKLRILTRMAFPQESSVFSDIPGGTVGHIFWCTWYSMFCFTVDSCNSITAGWHSLGAIQKVITISVTSLLIDSNVEMILSASRTSHPCWLKNRAWQFILDLEMSHMGTCAIFLDISLGFVRNKHFTRWACNHNFLRLSLLETIVVCHPPSLSFFIIFTMILPFLC